MIDSPGGGVAASIATSHLIRKHALKIIVDGRCLSAYQVNKINPVFVNAYTQYRVNREAFSGSFAGRAMNCPNCQMWVLDKSEMIQLGIQVCGQVWRPTSMSDQKAVLLSYGLDVDKYYFGDLVGPKTLCTPASSLTLIFG